MEHPVSRLIFSEHAEAFLQAGFGVVRLAQIEPGATGIRCENSVGDLLYQLFTDFRDELPENRGVVAPTARVAGDVIVAEGGAIEDGAMVDGPVVVCSGSVIGAGARVRDHTVIGPDCSIGFGAEITRSLLVGRIFMKHASFVGDSVIGHGVNIGAFVSTTGLRIDAGPVVEPATEEISVRLDGRRISTGHTKFGAVVGDGVAIPAGMILQPATLIGPHSLIYPKGNQVGGFIPAGSQAR